MKRHFMTLVLMGFAGSLFLVGNAEACHKRKCGCAPAPCVVEAPCPPPAPVCERTCAPKRTCGLFSCFKGLKLGCHRKAACAPACTPAPCGEVVAYSAPVTYSAPGVYTTPQGSAQR
jgi:hypothetical protein